MDSTERIGKVSAEVFVSLRDTWLNAVTHPVGMSEVDYLRAKVFGLSLLVVWLARSSGESDAVLQMILDCIDVNWKGHCH